LVKNNKKSQKLGEIISLERRRLNLTQAELASLSGVSTVFLNRLENDKTEARLDSTAKVLKALGLEMVIRRERPDGLHEDHVVNLKEKSR